MRDGTLLGIGVSDQRGMRRHLPQHQLEEGDMHSRSTRLVMRPWSVNIVDWHMEDATYGQCTHHGCWPML